MSPSSVSFTLKVVMSGISLETWRFSNTVFVYGYNI
jgi:hypothetical protein